MSKEHINVQDSRKAEELTNASLKTVAGSQRGFEFLKESMAEIQHALQKSRHLLYDLNEVQNLDIIV
jgi:hypothetical protein